MSVQEGSFFATLSDEEREALRTRGAKRPFPAGAFLFTEGDSSDHVFVVMSGRLKLCSFTEDGREVVLGIRGPGDLLGEFAAIDEEPRSASVAALEAVEALVIPSERFLDFLTEHPLVAIRLLRSLTRKLRDADRKRVEFGAYDTAGRVARRLVELAERFGTGDAGGVRIDLPLTQEELAGWTGSSREAVAKALKTLRDRGWIETRRRSIVVVDADALRRRSSGV